MGFQKAEIHFYEQEKCAVFLESDVSGNTSTIELQLTALFVVRMLSNFGTSQVADQLAQFLLKAPQFVSGFAAGTLESSLVLVDYQGHSGRYSFETSISGAGPHSRFIFTPKGFGWFGRGLGYYGPMAVQALIRKLAEKHNENQGFIRLLGKSAAVCGKSHLSGQIGLSNHGEIASQAILTAMSGEI